MKFPLLVSLLLAVVAPLAGAAATADPPGAPAVSREKLLARARVVYNETISFSPASLRYPLRVDGAAELRKAREASEAAPLDLDARWRAASMAEELDEEDAAEGWRTLLGMVEAKLKSQPQDALLQERRIQALIGCSSAVRVVDLAQKFTATRADDWRAQFLLGDAHLCRADFHWRVLSRLARGAKALPPQQLLQLNADLTACEGAYSRAVALAPAEPAPRAGRIALLMGRPLMASFLPKGAIPVPEKRDLRPVRQDLIELLQRTPGQPGPVWHAAYFFASQPLERMQISMSERDALRKGIDALLKADDAACFAAEAEGLLAVAQADWARARVQFETALKLAPGRTFAADWLGLAEARCGDPAETVLARVRARLAATPRVQDWVLLGLLRASDAPREAIDACRKALALDVTNPSAAYNLAVLLLRANAESSEARHHLGELLTHHPEDREAAFVFLLTQAIDGDPRGARRSLAEMLRLPDIDADLRSRVEETIRELPAEG
jgi:tetratricopeptide (TPR) repeat protein